MAVLKVACPKCGQRVSGDDSFYGTSVECPVCSARIAFPEKPESSLPPPPKEESAEVSGEKHPDPAGAPATPDSGDFDPMLDTTSIPLSPSARMPVHEIEASPVLGVISMVAGIITVVFLCVPGIILGPPAVICGHLALARAKHSSIQPAPGQHMALVGLILGYIGMAVFLVMLVILALNPDLMPDFLQRLLGREPSEE